MKNFKRFLLSVLFATLVFATCGMSTMAATKTKTLKQNAWYTEKDNGSGTLNKITVPGDGYITVTIENKKQYDLEFYLYNKDQTDNKWYNADDKKTEVKIAVTKGTYYLKGYCWNWEEKVSYKYKWKFTKAVNKPNYTASKALTVKANKEVVVVDTYMNTYVRWYKFKLTKKKVISIWENGGISVMDSNLNSLTLVWDNEDGCYYSRDVLPKGTYYIAVSPNRGKGFTKATVHTFKWK